VNWEANEQIHHLLRSFSCGGL